VSDLTVDTPRAGTDTTSPVLARLSTLDRYLPVWIVVAMAVGLLLGRTVPGLADALDAVRVGSVSLPIAVGLLVMMYPVLAKVRYRETSRVTSDRRLMGASLVLNWLVGPALMFALAWLLLPDAPAYRTGLIIVGLARCIAMVLIWNDLSCGDTEAAAVLVAVNSAFQVFAFAALGWFYLQVLPGWLGLATTIAEFSVRAIVVSVLVFLGVPLLAGYLTRTLGERTRGRDWYEQRFLPRIGPVALYGLLFTIVVLFALQGDAITSRPGDVARIALPLLAYFAIIQRRVRRRPGLATGLCQDRHPGVHRRRQQLRARDRRRDRHLRRYQRTSPRRRRRPPHRGPRPRRARLRRARRRPPLLPRGPHRAPSPTGDPMSTTPTAAAQPNVGQGQEPAATEIPQVLFVCVHNAGRSQMAAALLTHYAGGWVQVRSAGSTPADTLNPAVVQAMAEIDLDITDQRPKQLEVDAVQASDVVITMGCGDTCPVIPGKRYLDWTLDDPAGQPLEAVRRIRDQIDSHVQDLLHQLIARPAQPVAPRQTVTPAAARPAP
jgi:arsenical-resistance protein